MPPSKTTMNCQTYIDVRIIADLCKYLIDNNQLRRRTTSEAIRTLLMSIRDSLANQGKIQQFKSDEQARVYLHSTGFSTEQVNIQDLTTMLGDVDINTSETMSDEVADVLKEMEKNG